MKNILVLLAMLAGSPLALADIVATTPNNTGGTILITTFACLTKTEGRLIALTTTRGLVKSYGCGSMLSDDLLYVRWDDGLAAELRKYVQTTDFKMAWG